MRLCIFLVCIHIPHEDTRADVRQQARALALSILRDARHGADGPFEESWPASAQVVCFVASEPETFIQVQVNKLHGRVTKILCALNNRAATAPVWPALPAYKILNGFPHHL